MLRLPVVCLEVGWPARSPLDRQTARLHHGLFENIPKQTKTKTKHIGFFDRFFRILQYTELSRIILSQPYSISYSIRGGKHFHRTIGLILALPTDSAIVAVATHLH